MANRISGPFCVFYFNSEPEFFSDDDIRRFRPTEQDRLQKDREFSFDYKHFKTVLKSTASPDRNAGCD